MAMQLGEMGHVDSAALVKQCCTILRNEALSQHHDYIAELAGYIVGVTVHHSLSGLIGGMLKAGVLASDLSCSLMKCQLCVFEQYVPVIFTMPADKKIKILKEMIEHFNYIGSSIVEEAEHIWAEQVDALQHDLDVEHQHRILDVSMQAWKHQKKVKLLNYYKGLPVQVLSDIESVEDGDQPVMTVRSSKALGRILAMQNNAFVLTPDIDDEVLIHLQVRHEQSDKVSFCVKALSNMKKRQHFRLEPVEKVSIQLYRNKKLVGKGEVLDLSLKHMDISMPMINDVSFEKNEIVDVCLLLQKQAVKGCAWVRYIRVVKQDVILCLELMPQAHLQHNLQQEVAYLQRKIIQEIKEKFTIVQ